MNRVILITGLLIYILSSFVKAGNIEKINEDIKRTTLLLEQEKILHQKEKEQSLDAQNSLEERIEVLEDKIANLKNDSKQLKDKIHTTEKEKGNLVKSKETVNRFFSNTREILLNHIERIEKRIKSGFPYEVEEMSRRLGSLKKRLREKEINLFDAVQEMYIYFMKDIELGENSEIYSEEVETEKDKIKKAKFLRVGKVILAYQTNDGEESGRWLNGKWRKDLCRRCRSNIRKAIRIMEGKRIPELLKFPVITESDYHEK